VCGLGYDTGRSETQIVPVIIGEESKVMELCWMLEEAGVYVNAVVYPAVPRRGARLRFSVTSELTRGHLDRCLELMGEFGVRLGLLGKGEGSAARES